MATSETPQTVTPAGVVISWKNGNTDGHEFDNTGSETVLAKNTSGAQRTLTFTVTRDDIDDDLVVPDRAETIENGDYMEFGPFLSHIYNDANAKVKVAPDVGGATMQLAFLKRTNVA